MYPVSQGSAGGGAIGSSQSSKVISAGLIVLCMIDKAGCGAWRGRVHSQVTLLSGVFMGAAQGPLPQGYFLTYILQGFLPFRRGGQPGCSDTGIGLEVR